jgi:dipeptidyl aminopeptidase/acylaminoacyl peptidase
MMDSHDVDGDGFGDNLQRLTFEDSFNCDAFEDVSPQWSPNSSLIAYTSVRTGYFDIWLVNAADPSDLRNVTQTPNGYEDQPSWSPDGTRIIFRSSVNGAYELFSLPVPGPAAASQRTQLTFDGRTKQQADWGRAATQNGRALTVTRTGRGLVKSSPAGIVCGADCTESYAAGAVVTLTATPWDGAVFTGWAGACTGAAATCRVTMNATRSVTATFTMPAKTFTLTTKRAGMGNGQINSTPAGIACGTDCSQDYAQGTIVRLSARAWAGSSFTGWSGACTGTGTCQLTMNAAKSATATFKRP